MKSTTAYDDQFAPDPIQELEQKHHDKIVGIIAEKIEAERRPAPHGWKLVPVEPTPEMLEAGAKQVDWYAHNALECYHAMLAAAPTPPAQAAPSDADVLLDALSNLEHDNYERSYNGSKNREADAALIRAALECYGQAPAADGDALEDYKKNGAAAVRFAPSSAHWSNELRRLFGSDARDGIDRLEERLRAAEQDAARWRYIRRKLCLTGNGDGTCAMQAINLPAAIQGWPEPGQVAEFCDAAIDAAMQRTSGGDHD